MCKPESPSCLSVENGPYHFISTDRARRNAGAPIWRPPSAHVGVCGGGSVPLMMVQSPPSGVQPGMAQPAPLPPPPLQHQKQQQQQQQLTCGSGGVSGSDSDNDSDRPHGTVRGVVAPEAAATPAQRAPRYSMGGTDGIAS
jgi:hypothetical protein